MRNRPVPNSHLMKSIIQTEFYGFNNFSSVGLCLQGIGVQNTMNNLENKDDNNHK